MGTTPHVIVLSGEYDVFNSGHTLAEQLQPAFERPDVILDFTDVRYIDSSGINMLVRKRKRRAQLGYPPSPFAGLSPGIERLFSTVGLDKIWPFFRNVDDAIRAIEPSSR